MRKYAPLKALGVSKLLALGNQSKDLQQPRVISQTRSRLDDICIAHRSAEIETET